MFMATATVELYSALTKAGIPDADAKNVADALEEKLTREVVSKEELAAQLGQLEARIANRMMMNNLIIIGSITAIAGLFKLFG